MKKMRMKNRLAVGLLVLAGAFGGAVAVPAAANAAGPPNVSYIYANTSSFCYSQLWSKQREIRNAGGTILTVANNCSTYKSAAISWRP